MSRPRIDIDLRSLLADAELLGEELPEFDQLDEPAQDYWLYGWPNKMDIVWDLERTYANDEMSPEQEQRFRNLASKLRELAPAIERVMELRVPREVLDGLKML